MVPLPTPNKSGQCSKSSEKSLKAAEVANFKCSARLVRVLVHS